VSDNGGGIVQTADTSDSSATGVRIADHDRAVGCLADALGARPPARRPRFPICTDRHYGHTLAVPAGWTGTQAT